MLDRIVDCFVMLVWFCLLYTSDLAQALQELFQAKNKIQIIGIRHGEKMYETLLTKEEYAKAVDMGNFYRIPVDHRDLNYDKYFVDGNTNLAQMEEYNSDNTIQLNIQQIKEKLLTVPYVRKALATWENS